MPLPPPQFVNPRERPRKGFSHKSSNNKLNHRQSISNANNQLRLYLVNLRSTMNTTTFENNCTHILHRNSHDASPAWRSATAPPAVPCASSVGDEVGAYYLPLGRYESFLCWHYHSCYYCLLCTSATASPIVRTSGLRAAYLPESGQSVGLQTSRILQKLEMRHTFGTFTLVSGGRISCRSACIMSVFTFGSSFLSLASFGEQRLAYTGATLGSTLQLSLLGC